MGISLQKGQKVDLTKNNPGLEKVVVGLGWDTNRYDGQQAFDLDVSVFLLGQNGKVRNDQDLIFYNNLVGGEGSVIHAGDNRTGDGDGDDEQINIDLAHVPADVVKIAFTVTIDQALERSQNFGQVSNSYIHIMNEATNEELIRYDLGEDFSIETAIVIGELYRHNGQWKFSAIGSGYQGGLFALCKDFGVQVG